MTPLDQGILTPAAPAAQPLHHDTPASSAVPASHSDQLLALMAAALAAPALERAAAAVATELAGTFSCDRVFLGLTVRRFVKVQGISHGASLGREPSLLRAVGSAMDEALDQGASIQYPQHPAERPRITRAHADLNLQEIASCVLTAPMFVAGQPVGALMFERSRAERFDAATVARIEAVAAALAPLLRLKLEGERSSLQRLRSRLAWNPAESSAGKRRAWMGGILGAAALVLAVMAWPWNYQISAPTRLEGEVQRAIVAPIDGYLKTIHVRAGDTVRAGQALAELNDDDLRLERQRWAAEVARHENSFAEAQAKADRAQLVIADAQVAESRAQLALIDQQLLRTRLVAPFDALVIKGDLTQQLGAPLKRGELLLTLTPSRAYRVVLEIDERDIGQLKDGAHGAVTLSALPDRRFALVVERVMPVAKVEGGRNIFEAEARIDAGKDAALLRPGLQGVARIDAGERSLAWLISHRVLDWLRLQWWAWMG